MFKRFTLHFRKKVDNAKNKVLRKYYGLKVLGLKGLILQAGSEEEVMDRGNMYIQNREMIFSDIHILTEEGITNTFEKESEDFKRGLRAGGANYLDFLEKCRRFKIQKESPNALEEVKKKVELDLIKKTEGKYSSQ